MTCHLEDDMNVKTLPENDDRNDNSLGIHVGLSDCLGMWYKLYF